MLLVNCFFPQSDLKLPTFSYNHCLKPLRNSCKRINISIKTNQFDWKWIVHGSRETSDILDATLKDQWWITSYLGKKETKGTWKDTVKSVEEKIWETLKLATGVTTPC